jgi:alpha-beta hydrolase superfamily lysophospholipase
VDFLTSTITLFNKEINNTMQSFELQASDGARVACYKSRISAPRAIVQIAHGMGEHAQRYGAVADALTKASYSVYANDYRGHGETGRKRFGYMGGDGWNRALADTYELNRLIAAQNPGSKIVLLAHSMGSMMAQQYITRYGSSIDALALSGSPGFKPSLEMAFLRFLTRFEKRRLGAETISPLLHKLIYGSVNKPFTGPLATGSEWLSRDTEEVHKYLHDDACGFILSTGSLYDMTVGTCAAQSVACLTKIPTDLPIYIFSGSDDPIHNKKKDIQRMLQAFYKVGLQKIDVKWYAGARHEVLNEVNRKEVIADLLTWLNVNA